MKKNGFKKILLYTLFVFLVMFSVTVDTKAETGNLGSKVTGDKIYNKYSVIKDADTLCNAIFQDGEIKKIGVNPNMYDIKEELENINNAFQSCVPCDGCTQTGKNYEDCVKERYDSYKKLAIKCPGDNSAACTSCLNCVPKDSMLGPEQPGVICSDICDTDACKTFVEEQNKPDAGIEEKDLDSCNQKCDLNYPAASSLATNYEENQACKNYCTEKYSNTSSEDSVGSANSEGPNIHIGTLTCEGIADLTAFVGKVYRIGMVFLVVGFVILSMLDYGKAVMSDNQDVMKKANKHIVTRIMILAIYVFLPLLITMFIKVIFPNMTVCLDF